MRAVAYLLLVLLSAPGAALAQDIRYISDKQYVPLRSGAGNEYRIVHRGLPSGTRLTVARTSADGEWSEITTAGGTSGWIRTQYLMQDTPAQLKLESALKRADEAEAQRAQVTAELQALKAQRGELQDEVSSSSAELESVSEELHRLKQISGNAVQLDADNRRLVEEAENLRSEVEMLEAENLRLQDKLRNEDFINGAIAVVIGVIITLVVPRLWPRKRRSSGWA